MSTIDKLKLRICSCPKDFKYSEARTLLNNLGFREYNKGKTSGSRVMFSRDTDQVSIMLHKPHPNDEMKQYAVKQLKDFLKEIGEL